LLVPGETVEDAAIAGSAIAVMDMITIAKAKTIFAFFMRDTPFVFATFEFLPSCKDS